MTEEQVRKIGTVAFNRGLEVLKAGYPLETVVSSVGKASVALWRSMGGQEEQEQVDRLRRLEESRSAKAGQLLVLQDVLAELRGIHKAIDSLPGVGVEAG